MGALYLTGADLCAKLSSAHLEVYRESGQSTRLEARVPLMGLERVVLTGRPRISMRVAEALLEREISVVMVGRCGLILGTLHPWRDMNAGDRLRQYREAGTPWGREAARAIVEAKVESQRRFLAANRRRGRLTALAAAGPDRPPAGAGLDVLRGHEGAATAWYFRQLAALFPEATPFAGRMRRPARDPANALMSWICTLVASEMKSAVAGAGLDPGIGVLHGIAHGRPALALDLMEPFRAPACDGLVLRLLRLRIIRENDFKPAGESGGLYLRAEAMKRFFGHYEAWMTRARPEHGSAGASGYRALLRAAALDFREALRQGRRPGPLTWKAGRTTKAGGGEE